MAVQKGITLTTVKEVVQSLVDEDLVHQETIGASTYYWAFPSEASTKIENEVADLTQRIEELKIKRAAVAEAIEEVRVLAPKIQMSRRGPVCRSLRCERKPSEVASVC